MYGRSEVVLCCIVVQEMQELQTVEDAEAFMLKHGEHIIDSLGEEVDRIEKVLKVRLFWASFI